MLPPADFTPAGFLFWNRSTDRKVFNTVSTAFVTAGAIVRLRTPPQPVNGTIAPHLVPNLARSVKALAVKV
jgi:hypothetical protein